MEAISGAVDNPELLTAYSWRRYSTTLALKLMLTTWRRSRWAIDFAIRQQPQLRWISQRKARVPRLRAGLARLGQLCANHQRQAVQAQRVALWCKQRGLNRWRQLVGESSILGGAGSAMEKMRIGDPDEALLVLELLLFCGCGVARVPASIFSLLLSSCFAFSLVPFFVFATLKSVLLGLRDPFQPLWTDVRGPSSPLAGEIVGQHFV